MKKVLLCSFAALLLLASPAWARKKEQQLQESMDAYAAAIRWGEFGQAQGFLEPAYRQAHPLGELQSQRYAQVEISGYDDQGMGETPEGDVLRNVELRVVNKHTQVERRVHYVERWHYDAAGKRWWETSGLPDLWNGE